MNKIAMIPVLIIIYITLSLGVLSQTAFQQDNGQAKLLISNSTTIFLPNTTIQIINSSFSVYGINVSQSISDHIGTNNSYKTVGLHNADEDLEGLITASGHEAEVSLMPISISRASGSIKVSPKTSIEREFNSTNEKGMIPFSLGRIVSGGYILEAKEANGTKLLARVPLLVQKSLHILLPEKISPGDVLTVKVLANSTGSLTVGAIVMPLYDYNLTNITVSDKIALKRGDTSAEIDRLDVQDVMNLLPILPEDCTLSYQLQDENESTLNLITDAAWHKGRYVLICAAYDQSSGTRIAQGFVDLV